MLGGPQGLPEQMRKISLPPGIDLRTIQTVASRYIVYVINAHINRRRQSVIRTVESITWKDYSLEVFLYAT
jgi:hypothetical protein